MISYDGVIRKRLRLKGHPAIPPYEQQQQPSPTTSDLPPAESNQLAQSETRPTGDTGDTAGDAVASTPAPSVQPAPFPTPVSPLQSEKHDKEAHDNDGAAAADEVTPVVLQGDAGDAQQRDDAGNDTSKDGRTGAERRFDETAIAREKERLQKEATTSYREKVDVRFLPSSNVAPPIASLPPHPTGMPQYFVVVVCCD